MTPTPTPTLTLAISHIEVTQATQDISNSVPLVAGKPTLVRVYLSCAPDGKLPDGATVRLRGYGPSGELTPPLAPLPGYQSTACRESLQQQRDNPNKTLNFILPTGWTTGTLTLRAEVAGVNREIAVQFQPTKVIRIAHVPIHYDPPGRFWPCPVEPDMNLLVSVHIWAEQVFPLGSPMRITFWPMMVFTRPLKDPPICLPIGSSNYPNQITLLQELETAWLMSKDKPDYVFGWLPPDSIYGGIAYPKWFGSTYGVAAFGDASSFILPFLGISGDVWKVFAHEIGHLMGRRHTNSISCSPEAIDPQTDWPWKDSNSLIQDYGVEIMLRGPFTLKRPNENYDYMSYCGSVPDGNVWTSPWTYTHIFSEALRLPTTTQVLTAAAAEQRFLIASGLVYTDDTATLNPFWVVTTTAAPHNPPAGTQYCLEAQDASGTPLSGRCFDLAFFNYEAGEATNMDGFSLMLPYPDGVARIVLKKGAQVLAQRPVSAHAPTVTVLSPNGGEAWNATGTYTVAWAASDADGDPLTYSVLYSPDGSNWVPVAVSITATQVVVNAAELPGGTGARIRVLASDGLNTSADESDAPFTVGRKGPQVFILAPEGNGTVPPGTPLFLRGYAYDLEDGTLDGAALRWSSDRDGELGTGSLVLVNLSTGQHVITLSATDSDGNTARAAVNIFVGSRLYLPLVVRNR